VTYQRSKYFRQKFSGILIEAMFICN